MAVDPNKKKGVRFSEKQRKEIAAEYAICENYSAVARKYGTTVKTVIKFCKEFKELTEKAQKQKSKNIDNFIERMVNDSTKITGITDLYLDELKSEEKYKKTSAREAATVYGILVDKQLRLEEVRLKRLEAELKKKEIEAMEKGVSVNINPNFGSFGGRSDESK